MIPGGWKKKPLEHVAFIQTGIAKGSKKLKDSVELPYLRVANVQDGFLDLSIIKTIKVDKTKIDRYLLQVGDVLLTEGGDFDKLGRGTVWKGEIDKCVHQNHVFVARPKNGVILSEYLSLLTGSPYGKLYFLKCSKQSTNLASINSTQLKEFPVLLPPIDEQKAIANLLLYWNQAIEKTERLISAKEKRFSWLLNKLINLESVKGEWRKVKLGEVAVIAPREKLLWVEGETLLAVRLHCRGVEKRLRIKPTMTKRGRPYFRRFAGEFLIGRQNFHNGGFGIVPPELDGLIASNAITSLRAKKSLLDTDFLFFFFSRPDYYKRIGYIMDGTGQKEISEKQIISLPLKLPTIDQQKQIASILNTARREIDLLEKQAEAYRKQKRGLMQKLLTGHWRVKA
ncbi:MAG: restriction endonuclease subunit S [Firmicutes bacterium]|nr:restriction endonuclease subunit S [Bacillota bacterium]